MSKKIKVSVISTTLNESKTIVALLSSLAAQTYAPAEIIIVDAESTDDTVAKVADFAKRSSLPIRVYTKHGNRSIGRNFAITKSSQELVAITDAGCIPEKNWLFELLKTEQETHEKVIAGFYKGIARTSFESAVIPYALVMPDRVDEKNFLPATRSMLLEKSVWKKIGGFNESLSDNEDYAFARKLVRQGIGIAFSRHAVVVWQPRSNLRDFFWMIFRFARGDAKAKLFRMKVLLIFARYTILLVASLIVIFYLDAKQLLRLLVPLGVLYSLWAIDKNVRYVPKGWMWLPVLQVVSDLAVMAGTISGTSVRKTSE